MTILQELYSSMTGDVAKAILCVRRPGSALTDDEQISKMDSLQTDILNLTDTALTLGSSYSSVVDSNLLGEDFAAMEVQFNPNTLYINAQGEGMFMNYAGGDLGNPSANQLIQMKNPAYNVLQCQLIFDAVNVSDAFMTSDISGSLGNVVSAISSTVNKLSSDLEDYSVKTPMDGIMSLMTQEKTRRVIFIWGRIFFRGELMGVDNRYTMFNKKGNPIRGVSTITIAQTENMSATEMSYWEAAFKQGFSKSPSDASSGSVTDSLSIGATA